MVLSNQIWADDTENKVAQKSERKSERFQGALACSCNPGRGEFEINFELSGIIDKYHLVIAFEQNDFSWKLPLI